MTLSSEQRESARERLVTLAHSLPADKTLRDPQHGELNRLLDAIEAEARAPLLAQLDEAEVREGELRIVLGAVLYQYERAGWCACNEHSDSDPYPHTPDCPVTAANALLVARAALAKGKP